MLVREGAKPITEEDAARAVSVDKQGVIILEFPNGHIEAGLLVLPKYTNVISVTFEKPFKYTPSFQTVWAGVESMYLDQYRAVVKYSGSYKGLIPYVAIGLDTDSKRWSLEESMVQYTLISGAAGAVGGGLLGAGLSKL